MAKNTQVYINRKPLMEFYDKKIDQICDECDWKTHFTKEECVNIVADILEENPGLITISTWESRIANPDYKATVTIVK